jgi:hypothetical protein
MIFSRRWGSLSRAAKEAQFGTQVFDFLEEFEYSVDPGQIVVVDGS